MKLCLLAVLLGCLCAVALAEVSSMVKPVVGVADVPADADGSATCPAQVPKTICISCSNLECGGVCWAYTGTYAQCVVSCHPGWGWAPGTQVQITYFPYGEFSTGGCTCSGYVCVGP